MKAATAQPVDRLSELQAQATARENKRGAGKGATQKAGNSPGAATGAPKVEVRQLRDLTQLDPSDGVIVNTGVTSEGIVFVKPRGSGQPGRTFTGSGAEKGQSSSTRTRTVLPPSSDREDLALEAVRRALRLDHDQIRDMRERRGVGVDAIDELRQCYEIKMTSSAGFPAEVTLLPSEVEAAQNDPDFFLALVSGLEEGEGSLKVRFIFKPLEVLAAKINGNVTLTGTDKVQALEYNFAKILPAN
jgi:hypothetical protein